MEVTRREFIGSVSAAAVIDPAPAAASSGRGR